MILLAVEMGEAGAVAGLIAITLAVLKFAGRALDQRDARKARENGEDPLHAILELLQAVHITTTKTHDLHDGPGARDRDGILRWWIPREWHKVLTTIVEAVGELKALTSRQIDIMDRMSRDHASAQAETNLRLERIERQLAVLLSKIAASDTGEV